MVRLPLGMTWSAMWKVVFEDRKKVNNQEPPNCVVEQLLMPLCRLRVGIPDQFSGVGPQPRNVIWSVHERLLKSYELWTRGHYSTRSPGPVIWSSDTSNTCVLLNPVRRLYNTDRAHSALGYLTPVEIEERHEGVVPVQPLEVQALS